MRRSTLTRAGLAVVCAAAAAGSASGASSDPNLPSGIRAVEITSAEAGSTPSVALTVTSGTRVARIVAWIDRMRPVPRGVYNCPAVTAIEPVVSLTFLAHPHGTALARATEVDYGFGSYPCNAMSLTAPGRKSRALIGGQFLERIERLLKINMGFGEGSIMGAIYMAGGPAPAPGQSKRPIAGQVRLYRDLPNGQSHEALVTVETLPRRGRFHLSGLGPGNYFLRATVHGQPSGCPQLEVRVRPGKTAHVNVPWGCPIR